MIGDLERALTGSRDDDGSWLVRADPHYESANGMFGGWTSAAVLRAISEDDGGPAQPSAFSINFVTVIPPGSDLRMTTQCVGAGRSVSHWSCEITSEDRQLTFATASAVLAQRRDTDHHLEATMPEAPDPSTIEPIQPAPGSAGERMPIRPVLGFPPFGRDSTRSVAWVRDITGRAVDRLQLVFLADHRPPRSFFWSDGPRPSATLTLSVYLHATDEELAAVGDDDILSEAFGVRGARSTSEEHLRLWSRDGALLATSLQLGWYR